MQHKAGKVKARLGLQGLDLSEPGNSRKDCRLPAIAFLLKLSDAPFPPPGSLSR
jgi:hypothetical protein